jgi:hypothetical protein
MSSTDSQSLKLPSLKLPDELLSKLDAMREKTKTTKKLNSIRSKLEQIKTPRITLSQRTVPLRRKLPDDVVDVIKEQSAKGIIAERIRNTRKNKTYIKELGIQHKEAITNFYDNLITFQNVLRGTNHITYFRKNEQINKLLRSIPTSTVHTEYFNSPRISFAIEQLHILLSFNYKVPNPIHPGYPPTEDQQEALTAYNELSEVYDDEIKRYDSIKSIVDKLIKGIKFYISEYKKYEESTTGTTRTRRSTQTTQTQPAQSIRQKAATLGGKKKSMRKKKRKKSMRKKK